jgi:SAM-dependent methyltransferase
MKQDDVHYDSQFFEDHIESSVRSASVVAPLAFELVRPKSVVDVGCGLGAWAAAFELCGADSIGVDGDYVDRDLLKIPRDRFIPHDLSLPLKLDSTFDLAVCVEVAEHLPENRAHSFASELTELAPVLLWSAAIPGQGGINHINEKWPEYWREIFASLGFTLIDCFRHQLWQDRRVTWWYAQNIFLYAQDSIANVYMHSHREWPLSVVHPRLFAKHIQLAPRVLFPALLRASRASVRRRFHL